MVNSPNKPVSPLLVAPLNVRFDCADAANYPDQRCMVSEICTAGALA